MTKFRFVNRVTLISKIFIAVITVLLSGLLVSAPVNAQPTEDSSTGKNLVEYSGVQSTIEDYLCKPSTDGLGLVHCVNKLYRLGVVVGGMLLVFFIALAGYLYITGGENGKTKAKELIFSTLTGMAVLLTSYILLNFINPSLTTFKPIQPPIFSAADLPSCEEIGFEDDCILEGGQVSTGATGGFGAKIPCPAGKLVSAKGLGLPTKQGDERICEPFGQKLLGLKTALSGLSWRITDTVGPGHLSQCHKENTPYSGTCADIGYEPNDRTTANWNKLCTALLAIGQLQPINEADAKATDCPKYGTYSTTTGNHIHINWRNGGGTSGGGTTASGPKPYCKPIHGFLCDYAGTFPSYPDPASVKSSDATIQANINKVLAAAKELKKKHPNVDIKQVYRPHEYGAHMRSVFEAGALLKGMSEQEVKTRGFYCNGSIQYVRKSDVANISSTVSNYIDDHWRLHKMSTASSYDTTCLSDHGFGYAIDLSNSNTKAVERDAEALGLCHNLPGDTNHYVLKEKNRNNKGCSWAPK